jgi:hypothetical protein
VTTKYRLRVERIGGQKTAIRTGQRERLRMEKMRMWRWQSEFIVTFSVDLPSCAVKPETVEAYFGLAGQRPKMDLRRRR